MKKLIALFSLLGLLAIAPAKANHYAVNDAAIEGLFQNATEVSPISMLGSMDANLNGIAGKSGITSVKGNSQVVALLLAFFLGGLGIHRLYLGSSFKMVIFYCLLSLIGVGEIIALIDFIFLIIDGTGNFEGSDKLICWA